MKRLVAVLLGVIVVHASDVTLQIEACNGGEIQACYEAGLTLTTGDYLKNQDQKELGLGYMRKACVYGKQEACDIVGDNYLKDKRFQAAKPYLEVSCTHGIRSACEGLGVMYRDALECARDDVKSREYFEKACTLGGKDACINVALMYRGGFGVEKNRVKEKEFYQKACKLESEAGCDSFTMMDNEDKGIEEPSIMQKLKSLFN